MSRLSIYPDDFEPTADDPMGTLEEQAKLLLIHEVTIRKFTHRELAKHTGYGMSSIGHMLSPRRNLTMSSAQLLAAAMNRTYDLRLVQRAKAKGRYESIIAERDAD